MAETEILSTTNLQIASNSSANSLSSEAIGQNHSANGNFSAFLNGSIQEISDSGRGEILPVGGKSLPQTILPQALSDLKSTLQSFFEEIPLESTGLGNLTETLEESIADNVFAIQQQLDVLPETELALKNISSDLLDISGSIEDAISSELQNVNGLENQVIDELNVVPITIAQAKNASIKPTHIDSLNSAITGIENNRVLAAVSQATDAEIQQGLLNSSTTEAEESVIVSPSKNFDKSENASDKLNDFITKYLSEDNASRTLLKNQAIGTDILQQNISSFKSEPTLQNINVGTVVDSYGNLNVGASQHRLIEAPVPLLIKQGVSSELVQQSVDQSISQNVKWLIGNNAQNAKINVFPESLGQINIALNLEDSNLKLNFIASSNVTKELIEASVSTLRNHFSESGINLQEVNVETRLSSQAEEGSQHSDLNDQADSNFSNDSTDIIDEASELPPHGLANMTLPVCLLDAYA